MAFLQRLFTNLQYFNTESKKDLCSSNTSTCYTIEANEISKEEMNESNAYFNKDKEGTKYCAKVSKEVLTKASQQEKLLHEVLVLKNVVHPAVLEFKGFNLYDFENTPHPTLITLYMENGSVQDFIDKKITLNDTQKQIIIIGVASAMRYLHYLKIAHCNLKPSNVLLDENYYPRICDFGIKRKYSKDDYNVNISPEMLDQEVANFDFDKNQYNDIYSFAILCYQIITGKSPFTGSNSQIYQKTKRREPLSFGNVEINDDLKTLINDCYNLDVSKRPSFESIYSQLIDDWSLILSKEVELSKLTAYVQFLNDKSPDLNNRLKICNLITKEYIGEYKDGVIPNAQDEIKNLRDAIDRDFQPAKDYMPLINKHYSEVSNEPKLLAKSTIYANNQVLKNDENAKGFLNKTFGEVQFTDTNEINKENATKVIQKITKNARSKYYNLNVSPNVVKIAKQAFTKSVGKYTLQYINLPQSIESIEEGAFKGCENLVFINLNNNMTKIKEHTFSGCKQLSYVILPEKLTEIGNNAFYKCTSLAHIKIPPKVQTIGSKAFSGCKKLKMIILPQKVTIAKDSFPITEIKYGNKGAETQ